MSPVIGGVMCPVRTTFARVRRGVLIVILLFDVHSLGLVVGEVKGRQ